MTSVAVENLSKTYPPAFPRLNKFFRAAPKPPVEALKNVSFAIGDGEVFGLIGRNGAGKTTLTKIIATLVRPTAGRVSVKSFDAVKDDVKVRSLVGLATAEERSFYWRLTCEQNMMFFARLYGFDETKARRKIGELFERMNINEFARRRFSELSTGNKQRLAIARALLADPPVLLLDEPTRSLDPLAAADVRSLIASLENVSVLLTSHNLSEIEELCARVAVISKGEIRAVDTPENLRRRHRPVERVTVTVRNLKTEDLKLPEEAKEAAVENRSGLVRISFRRETGDELLNAVISLLSKKGATIIDVETEKSTLLDVLESYE